MPTTRCSALAASSVTDGALVCMCVCTYQGPPRPKSILPHQSIPTPPFPTPPHSIGRLLRPASSPGRRVRRRPPCDVLPSHRRRPRGLLQQGHHLDAAPWRARRLHRSPPRPPRRPAAPGVRCVHAGDPWATAARGLAYPYALARAMPAGLARLLISPSPI